MADAVSTAAAKAAAQKAAKIGRSGAAASTVANDPLPKGVSDIGRRKGASPNQPDLTSADSLNKPLPADKSQQAANINIETANSNRPKPHDPVMGEMAEAGTLEHGAEIAGMAMLPMVAIDVPKMFGVNKVWNKLSSRDSFIGRAAGKVGGFFGTIDGWLHTDNATNINNALGTNISPSPVNNSVGNVPVPKSTKNPLMTRNITALNAAAGSLGEATSRDIWRLTEAVRTMESTMRRYGEKGNKVADALVSHMSEIRECAEHAGTSAPHTERLIKAMEGVQTSIGKAVGVMGSKDLANSNMEFASARRKVAEVIEGPEKKGWFTSGGRKGGLMDKSVKTLDRFKNIKFLQAPVGVVASSLKSIPAQLGNITTHSTILNGGFIAHMGVSGFGLTRDLSFHINNLKHLCEVMEGKEDVSTFHALFSSDAPKVVQRARGQIFHQFGPRAIVEVAADAVELTAIAKGAGIFKLMVLPELVRAISNFTKPQYDLMPHYGACVEAQMNGMPLEAGHYAKLIAEASDEASQGTGGEMNALVLAVAKDYAEKQVSVDQVMLEIENGQMTERARALQNKRMAEGKMPGEIDQKALAENKAQYDAYNEKVARERGRAPAPAASANVANNTPVAMQYPASMNLAGSNNMAHAMGASGKVMPPVPSTISPAVTQLNMPPMAEYQPLAT